MNHQRLAVLQTSAKAWAFFTRAIRLDTLPPPLVGEHSGKVLPELGYRDDDIAALQNEMITSVTT